MEKYVVEGEGLGGGGGEYALQDGFGWTNGVTLMLLDTYCAGMDRCGPANSAVQPNAYGKTGANTPLTGASLLTPATAQP